MSLGWVIAGFLLEISLSVWIVMFLIIYGAAFGRGKSVKMRIAFNRCFIINPVVCMSCALIVVYFYNTGGGVHSYWWLAVPLPIMAISFKYLGSIKA